MFSQSKKEYTRIYINAVEYVSFSKIDDRIKHNDDWMESYPMQTSISVPTENAQEIIEKLKKDKGITSVDGQLTSKGTEFNADMRRRFF